MESTVAVQTKGFGFLFHAACCLDNPSDLVPRKYKRNRPPRRFTPKDRRRHFMALVLRAHVSCESNHFPKSASSLKSGWRQSRPLDSRLTAYVMFAPCVGESGETP